MALQARQVAAPAVSGQPQRPDSRTDLPPDGGRCAVHQGPAHQGPWQLAVHSTKKMVPADAVNATRELFHFCYWLARTYGRTSRPDPSLTVQPWPAARSLRHARRRPRSSFRSWKPTCKRKDEHLSALLADKAALNEELQEAPRRSRCHQEGQYGPARHPRLFRSRNPQGLHRHPAQGSRLEARPGQELRGRSHRHAQQPGHGLRRLRAVG